MSGYCDEAGSPVLIGYYDKCGKRRWDEWPEIIRMSEVNFGECWHLVFLHVRDVLQNVDFVFSPEMRVAENTWAVLYSGGSLDALSPYEQQTLFNITNQYNVHNKRIVHTNVIPHGASADVLRRELMHYVDAIRFHRPLVDVAQADKFVLAFRLLLQTFILAKTDVEQLPLALQKVRREAMPFQMEFGKEYWTPVLNEAGTGLCDELVRCMTGREKSIIEYLRDYEDWDNLSVVEPLSNYRTEWFKSLAIPK